jgi:Zn-dependent peptidase ImmA (M78 family)
MTLVKDVARQKAETVLDEYWDESIPVDPTKIAFSLSMKVFVADLPEDQSGLIVKEAGRPAEIYLNSNEPPARQNFTCAHELGHWFERDAQSDDEYSFVDKRGQTRNAHEWYAEHFAANLLMPARSFIQSWDDGMTVRDLAGYFAVSQAAVRSRLRNLGLQDE